MRLHIDIETYASMSLKELGLYKYVRDPEFQIMLISYAIDDREVETIDLVSNFSAIPGYFVEMLFDSEYVKVAHNAQFEITCFEMVLGLKLDWKQWDCTMISCLYHALPGSLKIAAKIIGTKNLKMETKTLNFFCFPHKMYGRRMPWEYPDQWKEFIQYNKIDVEAERDIDNLLVNDIPQFEKVLWNDVDHRINNYGIKIDEQFCHACIQLDNQMKKQSSDYIIQQTGVKPKSVKLRDYLKDKDSRIHSLAKDSIEEYFSHPNPSEFIMDILNHRIIVSSTSSTKYEKMLAMSENGEIRNMLMFYGAGRTGRWSSKGVQLHNLKRTPDLSIQEIGKIREHIKNGVPVHDVYGHNIYGSLVRTAIVPKNGVFRMFDFSAIEARVVAWIAGEEWALDVFRGTGKIYEAQAAKMYNIPIEKVDKNLRKYGKLATLALGFGGGKNALLAQSSGLCPIEADDIVRKFRSTNKKIVKFWRNIENKFVQAIQSKKTIKVNENITVHYNDSYCQIELPSGRRLTYYNSMLSSGKYSNREIMCVRNYDATSDKPTKTYLYGGLITENIVQAIARDILASCLYRLRDLPIAFHVHDEIVFDGEVDNNYIKAVMEIPPDWCVDLPLKVETIESPFYIK